MRVAVAVREERGSNPVEFVLVGTLLTALTLAVLQLAFAIYVRNVVHDAAVEGAYYAALADTTAKEGEERAREVIRRAIGPSYADDITVASARREERETVEVRIRTTLPVFGLVGVPAALQVEAHAPVESFDAR